LKLSGNRQKQGLAEIVYLVIPTLNDDAAKVREMSRFICDEAGPEVSVHFRASSR
jgi:pyruvate-formate lyase-activating enzyme